MPTTLGEIVAVERSTKQRAYAEVIRRSRELAKPQLTFGVSRTYEKIDDAAPDLPPESTRVQLRADEELQAMVKLLTRSWNLELTKDQADTLAKADLIIDGQTLIPAAPVSFLLYLGKQIDELDEIIRAIPVLDEKEDWEWSDEQNCYVTPPIRTHKTEKMPKSIVVWTPPTPEYKQEPKIKDFTEDRVVGYWRTIKSSGAMPAKRKAELLERLQTLRAEVKRSRERANQQVVTDMAVGRAVFDWLLR
jgi:hypothetical protein